MECCSACFNKTLHYESPAHGGWGVIRMAALVPEMHMLFVSPFACGRHGALGGLINGIKDRVSYLFIDEKDIVSGSYEKQIPDAVDELFSFLEKRPKVLFLFVSCLDDLLGTDHEVLLAELGEKYPGVIFRTCHMNPIQSDTAAPPGVSLQANMYSLLEERKDRVVLRPDQISLVGNNTPVAGSCELFSLLGQYGISVKQIGLCRDFPDFMTLADSSLNVVLSPLAETAARNMETRLGISFQQAYHTYSPDEITVMYRLLSEKLTEENGFPVIFDIKEYRSKAEAALYETAEFLSGTPVAIDFQAVRKPFTLAKVLLQYGFKVSLVAAEKVMPFERQSFEWLREQYPSLEVANPLHHDAPKFEYYRLSDSLCIGFDCGYMTGSKKVVNLMEDETMYGFDGVGRLMDEIRKAASATADVSRMIREAKLVV